MSLIKSYFSLYELRNKNKKINAEINNKYIKYEDIQVKSKYKKASSDIISNKGLSLNKIFVAKGNVKHTSSLANITLYVYNLELILLLNLLEKTNEERSEYSDILDLYLNFMRPTE